MTPIDTYAIYCIKKGRGEGKEGGGTRGRGREEGEGIKKRER